MPKVKMLAPRVQKIAPRIGRMPGEQARDRDREQNQPWRRWYHSTEWKTLRWRVLRRDLFTCQMCGTIEADSSKLIGDHKEPHQGDRTMFFDEANVHCLCKPCHDGEKQRQEKHRHW